MATTNKDLFFQEYRRIFGAISKQKTVEVLSAILDANDNTYKLPIEQLAYLLATAYHETGYDFIPKREYGTKEYFIRRYWTNSKVARWLGNDNSSEAVKYCGRSLVQITGETNYERFGIADNPEKALETETAIRIIFEGMIKGIFTGKKLSDFYYKGKYNYLKARSIINGNDKAFDIASHAENFQMVLNKSIIS